MRRKSKLVWWVLGAIVIASWAHSGWDFFKTYMARQGVYRFLDMAATADTFTVELKIYDFTAHRLRAMRTEISDGKKVSEFASFFAHREPLFDLSDISSYVAAEIPGVRIHSCTIHAHRGSSSVEAVGGGNNVFCTTHATGFLLPAFPVVDAYTWLLNENDWVDVDLTSAGENRENPADD